MQLVVLTFLIGYLPWCACLDVAVSPGTPLEWLSEYPFYGPQPERGSVPIYTGRKPSDSSARKRTVVREPKEPTGALAIPNLQDAMSFARIITSDVVAHLPWVNPGIDPMPDGAWGAAHKYGLFVSYGPQHTLDSHWFAMGVALRYLLHPKRITPHETRTLLTRLGPQILTPLSGAKGAGAFAGFLDQFIKDIPAVPPTPPAIKASSSADPFLAMAERLAIVELAPAYVYCLQAPFAPRSRALGEPIAPALVRLLAHPHPLVRENAALLLGSFKSQEACDALCKTAVSGKDAVCRVRALCALGNWKTPEATRTALSLMRKPETAVAALQALGKIGGKEAAQAILNLAEASRSLDFLFTAVPALGRCGVKDDKYCRFLGKLNLARLLTLTDLAQPAQAGGLRPDSPDAPNTKAAIVEQFAQIALARLGNEKARTYVLGLWKTHRGGGGFGQAPPAQPPQGRVFGRGMVSQDPLGPIYGPCTYYFLEALPELGEEGAQVLEAIFADSTIDGYVRMRAIWEYPRCEEAQAAKVEEVLQLASDAAVRAAGLQSLLRIDSEKARAVALKTIATFARDRTSAFGADVVMAFQAIAETGGGDVELLLAAYQAATQIVAPARPQQPQGPGQGVPVNRFEITFVPEILPLVLIELGRTRDARAESVLAQHLRRTGSKFRAEAALGLGAIATKTAAAELVQALEDEDAWVRYCAFRGLEAIRKDVAFQDWIFGDSQRKTWLAEWRGWIPTMSEPKPPAPDVARPVPPPAKAPEVPPSTPAAPAASPAAPAGVTLAEASLEQLLADTVAAARTGDILASERVRRALVARGRAAVPPVLAEIAKPAFPVVLIDVLEEISQQKLGLDPAAWRAWWEKSSGAGAGT